MPRPHFKTIKRLKVTQHKRQSEGKEKRANLVKQFLIHKIKYFSRYFSLKKKDFRLSQEDWPTQMKGLY